MKMNKANLWGAAGVAGLFLAGALMNSPQSRLTGATYSSPVSVVNTNANPAITQNLAQQAGQLVHLTANTATACGNSGLQTCPVMTFQDSGGNVFPGAYTVPAGQYLVVTTVVITPAPLAASVPAPILVLLASAISGAVFGRWTVDPNRTSEYHPNGIVVAPGFSLIAAGFDSQNASMQMDIFGYLTAN
jgi:hypothetical protein